MNQTLDETLTKEHILQQFDQCEDLFIRTFPEINTDVVYFLHLTNSTYLISDILEPFTNIQLKEIDQLFKQSRFVEMHDSKKVVLGILAGKAAIFHERRVFLVDVFGPPARNVEQSESETVISGPHDAFVESVDINISLIRRRLQSSHLKLIKLSVGEVSKCNVFILYIEEIVNMEFVDELKRRIKGVEIDAINDGSMLAQIVEDNPNSIFPQFQTTERPDIAVSKLQGGRVLALVDNSPTALCAPTSFFEFFSSSDDYYQRWIIGTALRGLRYVALLITITFTAMYVSLTTFHYEMIPEPLLRTLVDSRSRVPFAPVYEALLMETTIELLREAGARLPTKIGQTIGIVGGIVIGQAAVEAGLTSNVLIIAVALSAIASFVIPSYLMSASLRVMRFGLIILVSFWGNMGLVMGIAIIVIHLSGLTSLGAPYMVPVAPMKFSDWGDIFIRAPISIMRKRPFQSKTPNKVRHKMKK